jgi:hypothetical protein
MTLIFLPASFGALYLWRIDLPEREPDIFGPRAIPNLLFTVVLFLELVLLFAGIGRKLMLRLHNSSLSEEEKILFPIIVGTGVFGTIVLYMGLAGLLTRGWSLAAFLPRYGQEVYADMHVQIIQIDCGNTRGKTSMAIPSQGIPGKPWKALVNDLPE